MIKPIYFLTDMKHLKDFAAHCAMQNEQMAHGRQFKSKSESEGKS
jgi:hypothetical protein